MTWLQDFAEICQADAPLADRTWYKLGGAARWLFTPRDTDELARLLQRCKAENVRCAVLGRGANLLVRDEGFDGAVIQLEHPHFKGCGVSGQTVVAGAGLDFTRLILKCLDVGLTGLEALAGIPGTLGGIVRMNAGGRYGQIADFVDSVHVVTPDGVCETRPAEQLGFAYRETNLRDEVVVAATLRLGRDDPEQARARYKQIWQEKSAAQPALRQRSAGCVFKNPPGDSAGRLLDQAGLKQAAVGGAQISSKHANFIVAGPDATARDVLQLIEFAHARVLDRTGVDLQLEVRVL